MVWWISGDPFGSVSKNRSGGRKNIDPTIAFRRETATAGAIALRRDHVSKHCGVIDDRSLTPYTGFVSQRPGLIFREA